MEAHGDSKSVKLRTAEKNGGGRDRRVTLHRPKKQMTKLKIPLIVSYSREPNKTSLSIPLLLLFHRERFEGATKYSLLYFFKFERGASDELLDVEPR
jgi:hypothetical protein